jgi:hypothetical protein
MSTDENKSLDVLGLRPVASAIDKTTESSLAGAGAFLSRICLPAAEEFGLLLKDRVSHWRAKNAAKIVAEAEALTKGRMEPIEVHPRIAWEVVEKGSWADDDVIRSMWAGLLASSCTDRKDDSNILFVSLLDRLTSVQVRIVRYACESAPKFVSKVGLPIAERISIPLDQLTKITGIADVHRLDRELDSLRSMEFIGDNLSGGGFSPDSTVAEIHLTALALHLYIRAHGFSGSPVEYWNLKVKEEKRPNKAPEPTSGTVTPPAEPGVAPVPPVAHL